MVASKIACIVSQGTRDLPWLWSTDCALSYVPELSNEKACRSGPSRKQGERRTQGNGTGPPSVSSSILIGSALHWEKGKRDVLAE
jgi:hypothetical protein